MHNHIPAYILPFQSNTLYFRQAYPSDAKTICAHMHAVAPAQYDFHYTTHKYHAREFMEYAYHSGEGFFGYHNQIVGELNGEIIFICTVYHGSDTEELAQQTLDLSYEFYGWFSGLRLSNRANHVRHLFSVPNEHSLFLANLYVAEGYRGQGICQHVLNHLYYNLKSHLHCIELDVADNNDQAESIYTKLGFHVQSSKTYSGRYNLCGVKRMIKYRTANLTLPRKSA